VRAERSEAKIVERLPTELDVWGSLVQRKVERLWVVPGGIALDAEETTAEVSFVVDRDGNLVGDPIIIKHASDLRLGESGLRAILLAAPFPPLPESFARSQQRVVYGFSLHR